MSVGQMAFIPKGAEPKFGSRNKLGLAKNDAANAAKLFSLVGNFDIDFFRRRFHRIRPKFMKFERFFSNSTLLSHPDFIPFCLVHEQKICSP